MKILLDDINELNGAGIRKTPCEVVIASDAFPVVTMRFAVFGETTEFEFPNVRQLQDALALVAPAILGATG